MRRLILVAWVLGLLMPAAAWAAPFDAIPDGTLALDSLIGPQPGPIYDPDAPDPGNVLLESGKIAIGSKVFNANMTKLMRMTGTIRVPKGRSRAPGAASGSPGVSTK